MQYRLEVILTPVKHPYPLKPFRWILWEQYSPEREWCHCYSGWHTSHQTAWEEGYATYLRFVDE